MTKSCRIPLKIQRKPKENTDKKFEILKKVKKYPSRETSPL